MAPIPKIDHLANEINGLITLVTKIEEEDSNYKLCQGFVSSNFLHHRYLDVLPVDVWKLSDRIHQKMFIQSKLKEAKEFLRLKTSLKNSITKESEESISSIFYILLKLAQPRNPVSRISVLPITEKSSSITSTSDSESSLNPPRNIEDNYLELILFSENSETDDNFSIEDINRPVDLVSPVLFLPSSSSVDSGFSITPEIENRDLIGLEHLEVLANEYHWLDELNLIDPYWENRTEKMVIVTERIFCLEVIWLIQGVCKLTIFNFEDEKFSLKCNYQLSHLNNSVLQSICRPFCRGAEIVYKLQTFINLTLGTSLNSSLGLNTNKAFAFSCQQILLSSLSILIEKENLINKNETLVTLLLLSVELNPLLRQLDLLNTILQEGILSLPEETLAWQKTINLLSVLIENLEESTFDCFLTNRMLNMLLTLTIESYEPYLDFVEGLILNGSLRDPFEEFEIENNTLCNSGNESFWEKALYLRRSNSINQNNKHCLQKIFPEILAANKSAVLYSKLQNDSNQDLTVKGSFFRYFKSNLLQELKIMDENEFKSREIKFNPKEIDWTLFVSNPNPLLVANFKALSLAVQTVPKSKPSSLNILNCDTLIDRPIRDVLERSMFPFIIENCRKNNLKVIKLLFESGQLLEHLKIISSFFLLEADEMILHFCHEIFNQMADGKNWKTSSCLKNFFLEAIDAFEQSNFPISQYITIIADCETIDVEKSKNRNIAELEIIQLKYNAPWPINMILNEESLHIYQNMFTFLLQLKYAKYSLERLCYHEKYFKNVKSSNQSHALFLLRRKFLHFFNAIHSYFTIKILHCAKLELKENLLKSKDFKDLISTHRKYLDNLQELSFQRTNLKLFKETFLRLLELAITFSALWRNENNHDNIRISSLKEIEDKFNLFTSFLKSTLKAVLERKLFPHFVMLADILSSQETPAINTQPD